MDDRYSDLPVDETDVNPKKRCIGLSTRFKPIKSSIFIIVGEMFDLGLDKMAGDSWHDRQKATICHGSNFFNIMVMFFDEFDMREQGSEVFPTGEIFSVDQKTVQCSHCFYVRVLLC